LLLGRGGQRPACDFNETAAVKWLPPFFFELLCPFDFFVLPMADLPGAGVKAKAWRARRADYWRGEV
jgi:hypothetical protein